MYFYLFVLNVISNQMVCSLHSYGKCKVIILLLIRIDSNMLVQNKNVIYISSTYFKNKLPRLKLIEIEFLVQKANRDKISKARNFFFF